MKIFDKILGFLGFEVEEDERIPKKTKTLKRNSNLSNIKQDKSQRVKKDFYILSGEKSEIEYINIKPRNHSEIQEALDLLKNGNNVLMNLTDLDETEFIRGVDFIYGFCYCLDAQIEKIDRAKFKLTVKTK